MSIQTVTVLVALWTFLASPPLHAAITFDRSEESTLFFKDGTHKKSLKTSLHEIEYIGVLDPDGLATFLFRAKPCTNCLQDYGIYGLKPEGGPISSFVFPGKILDNKTRAVVYDSRAFFGKCVNHHGDVYVVFQKEKIDKKPRLAASVFIAEPGNDHMIEQLLETHLPRLQDTLKAVKLKRCHEIMGRSRLMLSKPLDLKSRRPIDLDDDSDDDAHSDDESDQDSSAQAPASH